MRINTKVISEWNEKEQCYKEIYSESYEYEGSIAKCDSGDTDYGSTIFDPLDLYGTRGKKAAEQAQQAYASVQERALGQVLGLQREILTEGKPSRDLALAQSKLLFGTQERTLPYLESELRKAPEYAKEYYDYASKEGMADIASNLAPYGLVNSGVMGKMAGTFQAGLGAQKARDLITARGQQTEGLLRLAGFQPSASASTGWNEAVGLQGSAAPMYAGLGQASLLPMQAQQAGQQSINNLIGSIIGGLFGKGA